MPLTVFIKITALLRTLVHLFPSRLMVVLRVGKSNLVFLWKSLGEAMFSRRPVAEMIMMKCLSLPKSVWLFAGLQNRLKISRLLVLIRQKKLLHACSIRWSANTNCNISRKHLILLWLGSFVFNISSLSPAYCYPNEGTPKAFDNNGCVCALRRGRAVNPRADCFPPPSHPPVLIPIHSTTWFKLFVLDTSPIWDSLEYYARFEPPPWAITMATNKTCTWRIWLCLGVCACARSTASNITHVM